MEKYMSLTGFEFPEENGNKYDLLRQAFSGLEPESSAANLPRAIPARPELGSVLAEFGPMPDEALFMGVAADGLPMLLNLHDPVPGSLLITADAGAGKTNLLQTIAQAAGMMHSPENVQFSVLTSHPEEWSGYERIPNNVGVFPFSANSSKELILSLASWAHGNKNSSQSVVMLVDDLETATNMDLDTRQNLRWLLLHGPGRRVWPVVTLSTSGHSPNSQSWLETFRTRIYGQIRDQQARNWLSGTNDLQEIDQPATFTLREGGRWTNFWLPALD